MLAYTFMPLAFFFDRMALADSLSGPFVAIALWATLRLYREPGPFQRRGWVWALIGGLALTAAIFSKISNIIFLCLPVLAALILMPWAQWRRSGRLAGTIYAACFATLLPLGLMVKVLGQSDLGLDILTRKTGTPLDALPQQILTNLGVVGGQAAAYLPFPLWAILAVALVVAIWKGGRPAWFVTSVLLVTLGLLIARTDPSFLESRYLPAYAPLLACLAGAGLATARFQKQPGLWLSATLMVLPGLIFVIQGWVQPDALPITQADRFQYIEGWPAGYGFREAADDLIAKSQTGTLVTLDLGGFERFEAYLLGRTEHLTAQEIKGGQSWNNVLLVLDRPKDDEAVAAKTWKLTEVARYPRPGGQSAVVVYQVIP
jgi:4-amino-4-deoxy-L-arabinose transferase-like glycosyltransferase